MVLLSALSVVRGLQRVLGRVSGVELGFGLGRCWT